MMHTPWTMPLDDENATLANCGGKGANLARLARAGFAAPPGFILPTAAYRALVAANDLQPLIAAALAEARLDDPEHLEAVSAAIRGRFRQGTMPAEIAAAAVRAYEALGGPAVAVRSSATAEDLPDMSFAGQQDTYLNVIGDAALIEAIQACWGSLWTARAIGYRARQAVDDSGLALAVIVQEMIPSEASGVLFTANPLNGRRTEMVIDATLGLGEALVSGLVEPDHFVVDAASGQVLHKALGAKSLAIVGRAEGGTQVQHLAATHRQALPDAAISELAALGRQVAAHYEGEPQDIEWAWAGGRLYLLQSRPITSLYPLPDGVSPEPLLVMGSVGAMQGMLDPMTPLGRDAIRSLVIAIASVFGQRLTLETQRVGLVAGERIFANITGLVRHPRGRKLARSILSVIEPGAGQALATLWDDPRLAVVAVHPRPRTLFYAARFVLPALGRVLASTLRPEANQARARQIIERTIAEYKVGGQQAQDLPARLALFDEIVLQVAPRVLPRLVPRLIAGLGSLNLLLRLARATPGGEALALQTTRGLPHNVTTEMDLALWEVASAIQENEPAKTWFAGHEAAELAQHYLEDRLPPVAQQTLARFLGRYGVRGLAEIDMGRPRWRENPTPVMQAVQSYLQITDPDQAPDAVFQRSADAAVAAVDELAAALRQTPGGWFKARLARWLARRLRALAGLRESPKWLIISMLGISRAGLLESGQELAAAGVIERPDDLFFLQLEELRALAAGQTGGWQELIAERRQRYQREMRRQQVPRLLLSDGQAFYEGLGAAGEEGDVITGSPVSPGVVEGAAHVVLDPHHARLAPGEILVCPGTDPSWTPLFLVAAGLVMEVGGMMTHGSVVAREYGIPAVVGVHQATTRLHTGQRLRVDGSTGQILVLDGLGGEEQEP